MKKQQIIEQPGGLQAFAISPLKLNGRVCIQQRDWRGRLYGITIGVEHVPRLIEILQNRLNQYNYTGTKNIEQ